MDRTDVRSVGQLAHQSIQLQRQHRLRQAVDEAARASSFAVTARSAFRNGYEGNETHVAPRMRLKLGRKLEPAHVGQLEIDKDDRWGEIACSSERSFR